jgi:hypothetical protein
MKVLCCFGLFFGKPNEKTKAEWVGFLNLIIFECVSMTRCKRFSRHSKLSETNIVESIVDQKVVATPFAHQSELTVQP